MKEIIVYYKQNNDNIYLFESNAVDLAIKSFNLEEFKKYKQNAYALVSGVEIKLF